MYLLSPVQRIKVIMFNFNLNFCEEEIGCQPENLWHVDTSSTDTQEMRDEHVDNDVLILLWLLVLSRLRRGRPSERSGIAVAVLGAGEKNFAATLLLLGCLRWLGRSRIVRVRRAGEDVAVVERANPRRRSAIRLLCLGSSATDELVRQLVACLRLCALSDVGRPAPGR